jgi:hypothetical protein
MRRATLIILYFVGTAFWDDIFRELLLETRTYSLAIPVLE